MENARVKVVVRVRPVSNREQIRGYNNILSQLDQNNLQIWDPICFEEAFNKIHDSSASVWSKDFKFDKCIWPTSVETQEMLFQEVGRPVVDWVLEGFNSCVLAFGQTGSGKTHSMMGRLEGSPAGYGLIPRICFSLFDALESDMGGGGIHSCNVNFSHLEIYNENVRDLLAPYGSGSLRVREHPTKGVFVSNLTEVRVTTFEEVMSLVAIGNKRCSCCRCE